MDNIVIGADLLSHLYQFVCLWRKNREILQIPELQFFRDFLHDVNKPVDIEENLDKPHVPEDDPMPFCK